MKSGRTSGTAERAEAGKVSLRPFRPSDLDALYRIDQSCFLPDVSYSRRELRSFTSNSAARTWVAEAGGDTIGFLIAYRLPSRVAHVVTIDVVRAWRRCRVGSVLMDAAEEWALGGGARFMVLETAEDNLAAQAFYEQRQYHRLERLEGYYANGGAAWRMVKQLVGRAG